MSEKTETATKAAAETTQKAAAQKTEDTVVYCGPTVRGVAQQFTPFIGGVPQRVQDFVNKYPEAAKLIVPYGDFAKVRERIASGKGAECVMIRSIKNKLEG